MRFVIVDKHFMMRDKLTIVALMLLSITVTVEHIYLVDHTVEVVKD